MSSVVIVEPESAGLLLIDPQTRLLPHIADHERVIAACAALLAGAELFELPIVATVQYVRGLGPLAPRLGEMLEQRGVAPLEKMAFSVCGDADCRSALERTGRRQWIVAGIEAHVCVQQTVLHLLRDGHQPVVCVDAVSSRRGLDRDTGLTRMASAGAVLTTTESVLFELCQISGTDTFKQLLAVIKQFDQDREGLVADAASWESAGVR
jgi:nicotinamidase-related amidase